MPIVMGIETSCDETSVALVDGKRQIIHHEIYSQLDEHNQYNGVVPEVAARAHLPKLISLIKNISNLLKIDAFAATAGPGLIGGVSVGVMMAKSLSYMFNKPFLAINHLEGHVLTPRLDPRVDFPYLMLLVSGGHTMMVWAEGVGKYTVLGQSIDDALGECFDKVAKILGLSHPGGPALERLAEVGDALHFNLPRPLCRKGDLNFSFSGLKTAVAKIVECSTSFGQSDRANMAASFQYTAAQIVSYKIKQALHSLNTSGVKAPQIVVAGGVGANKAIRAALESCAEQKKISFYAPPIKLCTDNGAMIAWAGIEKLLQNKTNSLDFKPTPRWPLG